MKKHKSNKISRLSTTCWNQVHNMVDMGVIIHISNETFQVATQVSIRFHSDLRKDDIFISNEDK